MLALGISYGACVSLFLAGHNIVSSYDSLAIRLAFAVSLTISILHFWYDGFIWSVRKRLV